MKYLNYLSCAVCYYDWNIKQPPGELCKKICSYKFRNIHRRTHLLESLFNKVAGLQACNFIKKRLQHKCFPMNILKFLRAAIFIEDLRWLVLEILSVTVLATFKLVKKYKHYKKRLDYRCVVRTESNIYDGAFLRNYFRWKATS